MNIACFQREEIRLNVFLPHIFSIFTLEFKISFSVQTSCIPLEITFCDGKPRVIGFTEGVVT